MPLEEKAKLEAKYNFSPWNVAMAMTHISQNEIGDIFPRAEPLKPEELYPSHLLKKLLETSPQNFY